MPKSIGTDPLAVTSDDLKWLVGDITRQQEAEAAAQRAARGPTGVGGVLARSAPLGVGDLLHAITQAAGANPMQAGLDAGIDVGMGSLGVQRPGIPTTAANLANQMAPPPEPGSGMQTLEAVARGGLAGAIGGPAGAAGGVGAGLGQDVASRLGFGPAGQMVGGLAGGLVGTGAATIAGRTSPANRAARAITKQVERGGEPLRQEARLAKGRAASDPTAPGAEVLGRTGDELAQQVASEGGRAGESVVDAAYTRANNAQRKFLATIQDEFAQRGDLDVTRALDDAQAAATGKTYNRLRYQPVEVDADLASLLDDPLVMRAYEEGRTIYNSRVGAKGTPEAGQPVRRFPPLIDERTEAIRSDLPLGALDEMKKGLDNLVQRGERGEAGGITARQAAAVQGRLEAIRSAVDRQYPEYGTVRAVSKHFFDQKDALQFGRELLDPSTTDDLVRQRLGELDQTDPALRVQVKMGLADAFHKGKIPADWASNPQIRARVAALVTPEEFATLDKQINRAIRAQERARDVINAGGARLGSVTQSRTPRVFTEIALGLFRSATRDQVLNFESKVRFKPPVRAEIADVLNAQGPDFVAKMDEILRRMGVQQTAPARGLAGAGAATGARRE